ncbi:MAG: hypothetical protein JXQ68_04990 [Campylobacterales bacterium]|nr:hypothetical protein [Campylobacterales bacterium]
MNLQASIVKEVLAYLRLQDADQNITVSEFSQIVKHYFFFGVIPSQL